MRLILTVVILKHVILSNIQLILVTVGTLESDSLSDSLEQSTDRTRCCLLLWPIWGIRKKQDWVRSGLIQFFDPLWNHLIMLIPNGSTWNLYRCNCNAEKKICQQQIFLKIWKNDFPDWSMLTIQPRFRKFYESLWIKLMHIWQIER